MRDILLFALLGLGAGALIAGIALAVVLTYRGAGIINLATGGVAMVAGYSFWSLRTGEFGTEVATAPALVITFAVTLVVGVLIELVAFRPLRNAAPLASSSRRWACCWWPRHRCCSPSGRPRSRSRPSCRATP
jgi:branched-chain amino acid transport system permease protein